MKPSPRIFTGSLLPALTAALLATATQSSSAATMVSNLGNKSDGNLAVRYEVDFFSYGEIRANTFTTGGSEAQLDSVTLGMLESSQYNPSGGFSVSIYNYSGLGPSTLLASLTGNPDPETAGQYIYTNGSSLTLAANTSYFVVSRVPQSAPGKRYDWSYTANGAESSPSGWSIGNESWWNGGLSWTKYDFPSAAQFSVQATEISPVPEPGVMLPLPVLLASGLLLRWRRK